MKDEQIAELVSDIMDVVMAGSIFSQAGIQKLNREIDSTIRDKLEELNLYDVTK